MGEFVPDTPASPPPALGSTQHCVSPEPLPRGPLPSQSSTQGPFCTLWPEGTFQVQMWSSQGPCAPICCPLPWLPMDLGTKTHMHNGGYRALHTCLILFHNLLHSESSIRVLFLSLENTRIPPSLSPLHSPSLSMNASPTHRMHIPP